MPTFETLRLRRAGGVVTFTRPAPFASTAPFTNPVPVLVGAEGDRPPRDVDLTLLLLPLLNGKPTEEMYGPLKSGTENWPHKRFYL